MTILECTVSEGPRDGYKSVEVQDAEGNTEYFVIDERFIVEQDGGTFVPVSKIGRDDGTKLELVQLPVETDSGAKRIWVEPEQVSGRIPA